MTIYLDNVSNLSEQEKEKLQQCFSDHKKLTGYEFDLKDLGWNEFVEDIFVLK